MKAVFLFHRDLRIEDNLALHAALTNPAITELLPIFIFTTEQIDPRKNAYFSHNAVQFMCESLTDLQEQFNTINHASALHIFYGDTIQILTQLHKVYPFQCLYFNQDHSYYAKRRDVLIQKWCYTNNITMETREDYTLSSLQEGLVDSQTQRPYVVLSQFYNRYLKELYKTIPNPLDNASIKPYLHKLASPSLSKSLQRLPVNKLMDFYAFNPSIAVRGGRQNGLKLIATNRLQQLADYKTLREFPANENGTSHLSAHIKFGTISIREVYYAMFHVFQTRDHPLIRELMFREFYTKIYGLRPQLQRKEAFLNKVDQQIPWIYDKRLEKAWQNGVTGFPLADAGMRQLNATGYTHGRVRMIQGSVATRYLLLDWRNCMKYYATKLVDIDPMINAASWQWVSATGVDAKPFRAPFNPFTQSKKFDPHAEYIYRWIPELRNVPAKDIHKWYDPTIRAKYPDVSYPAPIIDFQLASKRAIAVTKMN